MNLIGSRPDGWWRDRAGARRKLVAELGGFLRQGGMCVEDVAVVFDGRWQPEEVVTGVVVSFAPGGPDAADRVIASMARSLADPTGTTVVTSDAALAEQVRASGVAVLGVSAFRRLLDTPSK
jgi:predicted RNA-binding protein with PIN domain